MILWGATLMSENECVLKYTAEIHTLNMRANKQQTESRRKMDEGKKKKEAYTHLLIKSAHYENCDREREKKKGKI